MLLRSDAARARSSSFALTMMTTMMAMSNRLGLADDHRCGRSSSREAHAPGASVQSVRENGPRARQTNTRRDPRCDPMCPARVLGACGCADSRLIARVRIVAHMLVQLAAGPGASSPIPLGSRYQYWSCSALGGRQKHARDPLYRVPLEAGHSLHAHFTATAPVSFPRSSWCWSPPSSSLSLYWPTLLPESNFKITRGARKCV